MSDRRARRWTAAAGVLVLAWLSWASVRTADASCGDYVHARGLVRLTHDESARVRLPDVEDGPLRAPRGCEGPGCRESRLPATPVPPSPPSSGEPRDQLAPGRMESDESLQISPLATVETRVVTRVYFAPLWRPPRSR